MIRTPLFFIGICALSVACQSVFPGKDPRGIRDSVFVADSVAAMAWLEQAGWEVAPVPEAIVPPPLTDSAAMPKPDSALALPSVALSTTVDSASLLKPKPKPRPKPKPVTADTVASKKRTLPVLQPIAPPPPPVLAPVTTRDTAKGGL